MTDLPAMLETLGVLGLAYLLGSVSGTRLSAIGKGVAVSREVHRDGVDDPVIPEALARGPRAAAAAFDLCKGALAAWLALRLAPVTSVISVSAHGYLAGFAAAVGHVWPLWHRFRGGRGTATLLGAILVLWPFVLPVLVVVGGAVMLASGSTALAAVAGGVALSVWAWWAGAEPPRLGFALGAALLLLVTHRAQLQALRAGTAPWMSRARWLHRLRRGG